MYTEKRGSYTIPTELEESTWRIKIRYISLELYHVNTNIFVIFFLRLRCLICMQYLFLPQTQVNNRRLCRVKNMLAMYLKYHKAWLNPTTPVTTIAISPVKMSIGRKSLTNLRREMIFLQGKPVFLYLPTIYTPILTDNPQILLTMDT